MPTLLAIHAHPDDETLATGGTLARYSAEGVRTVVVTCTHGNLGELNGLPADTDVRAQRARELEAAITRLGVSRLVQLGYADSGMAGWATNHAEGAFFAAPTDEAAARIAQVIAEERPDAIITYDETGGYGHPDHVKVHEVGVAAYCISRSTADLYFTRIPRTWARAFVRGLRDAGIDAPASAATGADAGPEVTDIGVPDELITTRVDVRAYVEIKRAALACHRSQMPPGHFLMRMPPALAAQLWAFEYYSRERGRGASDTDLFASRDRGVATTTGASDTDLFASRDRAVSTTTGASETDLVARRDSAVGISTGASQTDLFAERG